MRRYRWHDGASEDAGAIVLLPRSAATVFVQPVSGIARGELETVLRHRVRAGLPVSMNGLDFRFRAMRRGGRSYGVALVGAPRFAVESIVGAEAPRVGVPLFVPGELGDRVLVFLSSPDGIETNYYENGVLTRSYGPIPASDDSLRGRIIAEHPDARLAAMAPDPRYGLPKSLADSALPPSLCGRLAAAFPAWRTRLPGRAPAIAALLAVAIGTALGSFGLWRQIEVREARNAEWASWLSGAKTALAGEISAVRLSSWRAARGVPVPELFERLAGAWGSGTRILDLDWSNGVLRLEATSPSAMASLRKLLADPWFRGLRVVDIRAGEGGLERFSVEGSVQFDK